MFSRPRVASLVAEFIGTAMLASIVIILSEITPVSYFIATSVAITLAVIVLFFGQVSGAHVNPAVTFGLWTARKISTLRAASYVAAQLLGGVAAWQLFQYLSDKSLATKNATFDTRLLVAEIVGAAILTTGVTSAVVRGYDALFSAVTIGAAIFVGVMLASVASSGYINPAVALANRSWSSAYVLGPLIGGLIGANLYTYLFAPIVARAPVVGRGKK